MSALHARESSMCYLGPSTVNKNKTKNQNHKNKKKNKKTKKEDTLKRSFQIQDATCKTETGFSDIFNLNKLPIICMNMFCYKKNSAFRFLLLVFFFLHCQRTF